MKKKEVLSDLLVFLGVSAVAAGAAMIYLPAGVILGGFGAIWIAWQLSRGGDSRLSFRNQRGPPPGPWPARPSF